MQDNFVACLTAHVVNNALLFVRITVGAVTPHLLRRDGVIMDDAVVRLRTVGLIHG